MSIRGTKATGVQKELEELIEHIEAKGYKVKFVSGKRMHDYLGMNPEAAKDMGWPCEKKTFLILATADTKTQLETLRHELIEFHQMKDNKKDYHEAHIVALKGEDGVISVDRLL